MLKIKRASARERESEMSNVGPSKISESLNVAGLAKVQTIFGAVFLLGSSWVDLHNDLGRSHRAKERTRINRTRGFRGSES